MDDKNAGGTFCSDTTFLFERLPGADTTHNACSDVSYCGESKVDPSAVDRALDQLGGGSLDPYPLSVIEKRLKVEGGAIVYYSNRVVHVPIVMGGWPVGHLPSAPDLKRVPFFPGVDHADISAAAISNESPRLHVRIYLKKTHNWRFEFSDYRHPVCR